MGKTKQTWQTGQKKRAFLGINGAKTGKTGQKTGLKKWANETEPWQNRAKPKVSPNFGSGLPLSGCKVKQLITTTTFGEKQVIFIWVTFWREKGTTKKY